MDSATIPTVAIASPAIPSTEPQLIAPETFLIPNLAAAGDGLLPVNSMVIRGAEPVIVDTGAPLHRELWLEKAFSVVEPEDVRWIFLSHDDGDHTGGLLDALDMCPQATLVTNFFSVERLGLEKPALPLERMRWIEPGGSFDAGDRTLHLFKPPIFDGPTTRGLYDPTTAAMWIVDTFACLTPGAVYDVNDLDADFVAEMLPAMNSIVSPWHTWLDADRYRRHVDDVESLGVLAVASAHGPVMTGGAIREAFDAVRALAGRAIIPAPGQELLDELVAQLLAGSAAG
jgi:flavorubredoxin